ncbi:SGNH/GDSL hydrolase family protein [uncultured Desulfobacter sp.]|uniref:SGNH/GDSL hydrolase family protein n=1 Tax=uncultured Desulfobacter sp. TaxID=240139 RepID=UPI002AABB665|nr:SGNH/GDSL hydrolase family protein [uncultured Desulfobacter sp.]
MKKLSLRVLSCLFLWIGLCGNGQATTTFDNLVVFGDSLSDTGNIFGVRLSDGDFWVEDLAAYLGADLHCYAYFGATTGHDNPAATPYGYSHTGLLWQIHQYDPSLLAETSLVTVWAGGNDLRQGYDLVTAATNIKTALDTLYSDGFRDFMVPNLPDIGATPALQFKGEEAAKNASDWTLAFNIILDDILETFAASHTDAALYALDIYSAFNSYEIGTDAWTELFWVGDRLHPSATGHALIANLAESAVATPEPQTVLLFMAGLLGHILAVRKQQNAV